MAKSKNQQSRQKSKAVESRLVNRVSDWFTSHFRLLSIGVIVLAGLLRLSFLYELPDMPLSQLHKAADLDMLFFDIWGDRIAGGDIWTDTIWHPYHTWHAEVAKGFGIEDETLSKQKWGEWYGGKKYHQEPLYPLLIAFAKLIAGNGLLLMYILQMVLSLLSIWMVIWLGRHYFSPMAGILGGLLFTLYGPGLLFDATLLRTSFSTTLLLGYIVIAEKLMQGKSKAWLMGVLGGAGYLFMTTTLLLWMPLIIRWFYVRRIALKNIWQVVLGFCLVLSFLVIRNSITKTPSLSVSSVGPITYILSNFKEYKPELGFVYFQQAGKILERSQGHMISSILLMIDQNGSVWNWLALQVKKFFIVFHWFEIPNNVNSYLAEIFSTTLKVTFIPYSFIAAIGLLGLILNIKNKKALNLHLGILSQVAVMVIFYVLCRFRVPLVAMLCVFGGYTLQQLATFKPAKRFTFILIGAIALWLTILRPFPNIQATFTRGDLATNFNNYYLPKLNDLSAKQDFAGCVKLFDTFLKTMPDYVSDRDQLRGVLQPFQRDVVHYYGLVYGDLVGLYESMGDASKAKECKEKSEMLMAVGSSR